MRVRAINGHTSIFIPLWENKLKLDIFPKQKQ